MYAALCEPLLRRPGAAAAGAAAAASLRYHCAAQCCAVACRTSGRFRAARSSGVEAASPSVLVRCNPAQLAICRLQDVLPYVAYVAFEGAQALETAGRGSNNASNEGGSDCGGERGGQAPAKAAAQGV